MTGYVCSECGREIGLLAGPTGKPHLFICPHTGRVAELQVPVHRKPPRVSRTVLEQPEGMFPRNRGRKRRGDVVQRDGAA